MHINKFDQLRDADRRAVLATIGLVAQIGPADLDRPTPCANWTLADLLAHLTVQQHGFADAARGGGGDLERWLPAPLGPDPVAAYSAACARVLAEFAAPGVEDRAFLLPEIRDGGPFPAQLAMSFHLVDNVVHAWDVAEAMGVDASLDDDVVEMALPIAAAVPDGPPRLEPGAAFAPGRPAGADASALDRIVLLLGRTPGWRSTSTTGRRGEILSR